MKKNTLTSLAALLGVALASASGAAFVPGDVFSLTVSPGGQAKILNITTGGNFSNSSALANPAYAEGQIAWSGDLSTLYVTRRMVFSPEPVSVWAISATGAVTSFATNAGTTRGIVQTTDGRLLASLGTSPNAKVVDITTGGNFGGNAPAFATGFRRPGSLVQLASGRTLVVDMASELPRVLDITAGGVFTDNDEGFAFGFTGGLGDIVQTSAGRLFVVNGIRVFDITAGGDFSSATPFATNSNNYGFTGLTEDGSGRLLASVRDGTGIVGPGGGKVYDITAGGDIALAAPFAAGLALTGGSHYVADLATVPTPEPSAALLACIGSGLLACRRNRKPRP